MLNRVQKALFTFIISDYDTAIKLHLELILRTTVLINNKPVRRARIAFLRVYTPPLDPANETYGGFQTAVYVHGQWQPLPAQRTLRTLAGELNFPVLPKDDVAINPALRCVVEPIDPDAHSQLRPPTDAAAILKWHENHQLRFLFLRTEPGVVHAILNGADRPKIADSLKATVDDAATRWAELVAFASHGAPLCRSDIDTPKLPTKAGMRPVDPR